MHLKEELLQSMNLGPYCDLPGIFVHVFANCLKNENVHSRKILSLPLFMIYAYYLFLIKYDIK